MSRPCGSVVEHSLGKGEVARSIRAMGTNDVQRERQVRNHYEGLAQQARCPGEIHGQEQI